MLITNKTTLNIVIGYPLEHTKSPLLHNFIYQMLNLNAVLLAFANQNLDLLIKSIKTLNIGLTAVTMPFKEEILSYLDESSEEVKAIKAANTIIQKDGKLMGFNTDIDGIQYALKDITLKDKKILIIGAGGAARALAFFLKKNHAKLYWLNRTRKKAIKMTEDFAGEIVSLENLARYEIDIFINTTSLGMFPDIETTPLIDYTFNAKQIVFDMIYHPINTALLKKAKKEGAKIISGVEMFIGQGIRQIELWTESNLNKKISMDSLHTVLLR